MLGGAPPLTGPQGPSCSADLTVHSQNDGQGKLWTWADGEPRYCRESVMQGEGGRAVPGGGRWQRVSESSSPSRCPSPSLMGPKIAPTWMVPRTEGVRPQDRCHHPRSPLTPMWMSFLPRRHLTAPSQGSVVMVIDDVMAASPLPLPDPSLPLQRFCSHSPSPPSFFVGISAPDSISISSLSQSLSPRAFCLSFPSFHFLTK